MRGILVGMQFARIAIIITGPFFALPVHIHNPGGLR